MKKTSLLFILPFLTLMGCGHNDSTDDGKKDDPIPEPTPDPGKKGTPVTTEMPGQAKNRNVTFYYDDSYFEQPSNKFNKDIAMFAFGASVANGKKENLTSFYTDLGFKDVYLPEIYDSEPTDDSIGYAFGHKQMKDGELVLVSIRGFYYGSEWSNNLKTGKEGDHQGFKESAETVIADLLNYVEKHNQTNSKFLITGYSRGGGVANVMAKTMFERESSEKAIPDSSFYFYTFEAPRGCDKDTAYENVFNIINGADLIPQFAPAEYGLYRVGNDIDIYTENVNELVKEFDETISIPDFVPNEGNFDKETEFPTFILDTLLKQGYEVGIETREKYVDNAEPAAQYALKMFMNLKSSTLTAMMEALKELGFSALSIIETGEALCEFLKPFLDEDGFAYDEAELLTVCTNISNLITKGPLIMLILFYLGAGDNFSRMISMHYPEVNYPLLNAYAVK